MSDLLRVKMNGVEFENPFIVGSGPPSTNAKVIARSFEEGWGGSVIKTVSLDHTKVRNVAPRFGKLNSPKTGETIGFTNIELITDRPLEIWLEEIKELKRQFPEKVIIGSIMEEPSRERWQKLTDLLCKAGVDLLEINFSCPHGMPERKMGLAMGQCPDMVEEVTKWVKEASTVPVWAKMTPNITDICEPAQAALKGGADGLTAINTILSIAGIDLKTLKPIPTVQDVASFGGYCYTAIKPIGLRMVGELAMKFKDTPISGVGGIVDSKGAAEYLLMGSTTMQVCAAIMLDGFKIITELKQGLEKFARGHEVANIMELKGKSLHYFGTMAEMADRMDAAKKAKAHTDNFSGDTIVSVSSELTQNS